MTEGMEFLLKFYRLRIGILGESLGKNLKKLKIQSFDRTITLTDRTRINHLK